MPPGLQMLNRRSSKAKRSKYDADLRQFALSLQFHSSQAYEIVRRQFGNMLPASSTIRKWLFVHAQCGSRFQHGCSPSFEKKLLTQLKNPWY